MADFVQFLNEIRDIKDRPVKLKQIKKILKVSEKSFPPCKNIQNYYFQEFSKRTNEEHRTKWHKKDKILFVWTVLKYFEMRERQDLNPVLKLNIQTDEDWSYLSKVLGISEQLLNLKWISMLKTNLKMAPWHPEEDESLRLMLLNDTTENKNWTQITIDFNRINPMKIIRHAKQIRERWNNYINPDLRKCEWSKQEQLQLLQFVQEMGKRWSLISKRIVGRTENQVKNQYNSIMNAYRRQNQLDNEDLALNKLLAQLQGKDYDEPQQEISKRIRKQKQPEQEIKVEPEPEIIPQQQYIMNIPVFSPMMPFHTPIQYLICNQRFANLEQSPNNIQSPFEITKQAGYQNQFQLFDDILKSGQLEKRQNEIPFYLKMYSSPQPIQTPAPIYPVNQTQVSKLRKELIKFDSGMPNDI
ncbi:hypothetical protein pb186bvf_013514 [Paramecium bursaria]